MSNYQSETGYTIVWTEDIPDRLDPQVLYVEGTPEDPCFGTFVCPCNCGETITLNFIGGRPRWSIILLDNDEFSIAPSVHRTVGCKSHFFIRESRIRWCESPTSAVAPESDPSPTRFDFQFLPVNNTVAVADGRHSEFSTLELANDVSGVSIGVNWLLPSTATHVCYPFQAGDGGVWCLPDDPCAHSSSGSESSGEAAASEDA